MKRLLLGLLGCLAILVSGSAAAHTRSESHTSWLIDGNLIHMTFSISDAEGKRLTSDGRPPNDPQLIAYLTPKERATAGGAPCRLIRKPDAVAAAAGYRRVEFYYQCPSTQEIVLRSDAFFELVPTHVTFAQIQKPNGDFVEQLLTDDHRDIVMQGENGEGLEQAGFLAFVRMGIMHIFTGIDHMSFLLGLVLISRRLRDLAFVVTGFTLGHSLTLGLAITGIIRPHAEYIDALVALTIALIGVENIAVTIRRPGLMAACTGGALLLMGAIQMAGIGLLPPLLLFGAALFSSNYLMVTGHLRDAARLRLVVTLVFGLIHGFGFAADLLTERIPASRLAELLVGFNVGVEIGQLTIVLLLTGLVRLLSRVRLTLPRPIVVDVTASGLVAIGTYWFVSRSFG